MFHYIYIISKMNILFQVAVRIKPLPANETDRNLYVVDSKVCYFIMYLMKITSTFPD
jgi:hypothetical protein